MKADHAALDAITDVPGIKVGHWTNRRAATGCTVILCADGAVGGVSVRGGAPGTRETDPLRPGHLVRRVHAVVLAGGSAFGLDAACGAMRYLEEQGVGYQYGGQHIPIVPAAILFDLGIGRADVRPTAESGYRAARAAKGGRVAQGSVGAGTGATVAKAAGMARCLKGGLGTACETWASPRPEARPEGSVEPRGPSGLLAGALAAVNAAGDIIDPDRGRAIAAPRAEDGGFLDGWGLVRSGTAPAFQPPPKAQAEGPSASGGDSPLAKGESTTLAVVATNARLSKEWTNRLAAIAHDGLARTIRPAHGMTDGDIVFVLATGRVAVEGPAAYRALEAMAVRAVERAIVRGVLCATGLAGVPSAQEWAERSLG